ncbi:Developmental regulatory protein [Lachnellula hyalina]|uniref:Developmental regulatory protein wetA n=1 Tax=Lachnellula hyalina TaxID=1316788 RepID=A0A8H8QYI4_9HELO|nr:Developmental regulatory protein [Lachnellula hyalina]TVY25094.1 Developmental regulatory protein [Lachnellula hyalina]
MAGNENVDRPLEESMSCLIAVQTVNYHVWHVEDKGQSREGLTFQIFHYSYVQNNADGWYSPQAPDLRISISPQTVFVTFTSSLLPLPFTDPSLQATEKHYINLIPKPYSNLVNESAFFSMSSSAVASYPSDKGTDPNFFGQGFEDLDHDFFEQFLTFSPTYSERSEYSALPQPNYLQRSLSDSHETLSSLEDDSKNTNARESWQGDSWATFDPALASSRPSHIQGNGLYSSGRAAISDGELLSLEGITLDSPHILAPPQHSLPSSPSSAATVASRRKTRLVESLSKTFKKATSNIERSLRSPIRKNSSPKMGRAPNLSQSSIENLGNKLQADALTFKFDFEENPVSFLSPTGVADRPTTLDEILELDVRRPDGPAYNTPQINQATALQTPQTTPLLSNDHSPKSNGEEVGFPITPQHQNTTAFWWRQAPGSSERNNFGSPSIYPSADIEVPIWWNHAPTAPMAQPLPNGYHTNPQLATKSLAHQLQNDLAYQNNDISCNSSIMASGLMIQMPGFTPQQSFVTSPPLKQQGFTHSAPQPQPRYHARRPYNQASPRQPSQTSPVRKNRSSGSSDSDSPKSPSTGTGFHVRKRKSPKMSKHSTPRMAPGFGGAGDFVNYTPSDSRKILTGVAPSGSSKTKARREKEAMDKRRRLSQAALRAVKAAGGDVESLVEQGLFA